MFAKDPGQARVQGKVIEHSFWVLPRSLFDAVKFRVQFCSNAVLLHCFLCLRLGLLEPFPMYMAFPCSEYYDPSDFSMAISKLSCINLEPKYPCLIG